MTPAVDGVLQLGGLAVATPLARVLGVIALAGGLAAGAAVVARWYAGERVQEGLAVLVGLAAVAVYLNTTAALGQVIVEGGTGLFDLDAALLNVGTFLLAGGASLVGRRAGDRLALEAMAVTGRGELEVDVSRLVAGVGRVVAVRLPDQVDDLAGYDPVPDETKVALAGTTVLFPRRLTPAELRDRLRSRLADDYGVGHVDLELADGATVTYLAVGRRAAGLGPTLAPGTAAVAVRADPPHAASSGDVVELWRDDPDPEPVAVGELRAAAGDVVTVALDEPDARALEPAPTYRLVTRAATPRADADRQIARVLRSADERLAVVTVEPGSALVGSTLAEAAGTVVAVRPAAGELLVVPPHSRAFEPGDVAYAVGRPEALRRLEAAAGS